MRIPNFIGGSDTPRSRHIASARLVNLYLEVGNEPALLGTPGNTVFATLPDSPIRAVFYEDGRLYAVAGTHFCEVFVDGSFIDYGDILLNDLKPATISSNGAAGHQLFIVADFAGYIFDTIANTLTRIIAPAFPLSPVMGLYTDGYFVVLQDRSNQFQISALEDGLTWNGLDAAQRESASEPLVAIAMNHKELWLFGQKKTEGWYNSGNASFPFAPFPGAFLDQGAIRYSISAFDNTLAWVSANDRGGRVAYRMNGYTPERISTHGIEAAWRQYAVVDDAESYTYEEDGHVFWIVTFPTAEHTWCYDAATATQGWSERDFWDQPTATYTASRARCHAYAFGQHIVGCRYTNRLYTQSLLVYDDVGAPIRRRRRTPILRNEQHTIFLDRLELCAEVGTGMAGAPQTAPQATIRVSYDEGQTFGNDHLADFGVEGAYETRLQFDRFGSGRNPVIEVEISDPLSVAITDLYADLTVGTD